MRCTQHSVAFVIAFACNALAGCRFSDSAWRTERAAIDIAERRDQHAKLAWLLRAVLPDPFRCACDLASTPEGIVVAAAVDPLSQNGAALFRIIEGGLEGGGQAAHLLELLSWDGQGFLRVRSLKNRMFVPDADAPFSALAFAFTGDIDGYLFVSDTAGAFARARHELLPRVYHVLDVAELASGLLVSSTGAYPAGDIAYLSSAAPGALFVDDGALRPWRRVLEYPRERAAGVTRLTQLAALPDGALLAAIETSRNDLPPAIRISGLPDAPDITAISSLLGPPVRWALLGSRIFAVTAHGSLHVSTDGGRTFTRLRMGGVQNVLAAHDELLVLADGALWAAPEGNVSRFERLADAHLSLTTPPTTLVTHGLVVHEGHVFASSSETGEVFEAALPL